MMAKYKKVCWLARGIPAGVVAGGEPCKVIRPITGADLITYSGAYPFTGKICGRGV